MIALRIGFGAANEINRLQSLTFDCYGTLIDWEAWITDGLKPLLSQLDLQAA